MIGTNLTDHFLIAMPSLSDPNFSRTVTYICEHSEEGAMGIVINRATDLHLWEILEQLDIDTWDEAMGHRIVHNGGPVQPDRGFILHSGETRWDSTLRITDHISVTASRDILEAMARNEGPEKAFVALGYAGWAGGQLEMELSANSWLSGPSDDHILFELPESERWRAAAELLGVDLDLLSAEAGHA